MRKRSSFVIHLASKRVAASLLLCFPLFAQSAQPRCVLQVPDGGGVVPSEASVAGEIVRVRSDVVTIRTREHRLVKVRIPAQQPIYTVFGATGRPPICGRGSRPWFGF